MYEISTPEEFHCASQLLQKMPDDNFVQATRMWSWIFLHHVSSCFVLGQLFSPLDEE
jgi:hypothetical protein